MLSKSTNSILLTYFALLFLLSQAADTSHNRETWLQTKISQANSFITDPSIRSQKYKEMMLSPFSFYRATAYLYYSDMSSNGTILIPFSWKVQPKIKIWLSGDYHAQNIGYFDDNEGTVVFDLNDSDDSYIGPFYWDLIRFSTSLFLMTNETALGLSITEQEDLVSFFLQVYQDTLQSVIDNPDNIKIELDESFMTSGFVQDELRYLQKKKTIVGLLDKYTVVNNGVRSFDLSNEKLAAPTYQQRENMTYWWPKYITSLSPSFVKKVGNSSFVIKDIARRLDSGLGSQGVDKYYVLIEGVSTSQDDDELLEVKEENYPSLFNEGSTDMAQYNSWFTSHAERVVTAKKALGTKVDNYLGSIYFMEKSFKVARISPYKFGFESSDFEKASDVQDLVKYAGIALGLAHARSDKDYDPKYISYNFEKAYFNATDSLIKFKSTVNALSEEYYYQVVADFEMFKELVQTGQLF